MQSGTINIDTQTLLDARIKQLKSEGFSHVSVAHCGGINQDLIHRLSEYVEEMLISAGAKKNVIKRIFSIVVEGLQNILIHGERIGEDQEQLSMLIVASSATDYKVTMGNITATTERSKLLSYIEKLNGMDENEVKEFYLETLNNGLISDKGGAGLGFITMRMKSKNKLHCEFEELSESQLFFVITTVLQKEA